MLDVRDKLDNAVLSFQMWRYLRFISIGAGSRYRRVHQETRRRIIVPTGHEPCPVAKKRTSAPTAASGSAARITSPITATPRAPAAMQAAALATVIPPSAMTGPGAPATASARPARPSAGPYPGLLAVAKTGLSVT